MITGVPSSAKFQFILAKPVIAYLDDEVDFLAFQSEGATVGFNFVVAADSAEDLVRNTEVGLLCRDEAANLCHDLKQGHLA